MFTGSDVSVVIPSYQSSHTVLNCLASLYHQEELPGEILLIDSSEDNTLDLVREHYPDVRIYKFDNRTFPGPARNRGARRAKGKIIAFIDSDCVASPDWLKRMLEHHNTGQKIVGGAVIVGASQNMYAWAGYLGEFRDFLPVGPARPMVHVPTCNISYRREILEEYGGFPNSFYPQEDLIFNHLLHRNGYAVWFDPKIQVQHYCRDSFRGYLSHQHRMGRVTYVALRIFEMEGSSIARNARLAWLASPLLGLVKYVRNLYAIWRSMPREAFSRPGLIPLLFVGAVWWARGFAAGSATGLTGKRGIIDPEEDIFILFDNLPQQPKP